MIEVRTLIPSLIICELMIVLPFIFKKTLNAADNEIVPFIIVAHPNLYQ